MKKLRSLLSLLAAVVVGSGCAGMRPDPSPSAVDSNYPSAELYLRGELSNGIAVTSAFPGERWDSVNPMVQTYGKGILDVVSTNCPELTQSFSYQENEKIQIRPKSGHLFLDSCLITVTVRPQFPKSVSDGIEVYNLRGHFVIRSMESGTWVGSSYKVTGAWQQEHVFQVPEETSRVAIVINGCGISHWRSERTVKNGQFKIALHEISRGFLDRPCILTGFYSTNLGAEADFDIVLVNYKPEFTPLAYPSIQEKPDKLNIDSDRIVSIVAVNKNYKISNAGSFSWNPEKRTIVRIWTNKGRTAFCERIPTKAKWECHQ